MFLTTVKEKFRDYLRVGNQRALKLCFQRLRENNGYRIRSSKEGTLHFACFKLTIR